MDGAHGTLVSQVPKCEGPGAPGVNGSHPSRKNKDAARVGHPVGSVIAAPP